MNFIVIIFGLLLFCCGQIGRTIGLLLIFIIFAAIIIDSWWTLLIFPLTMVLLLIVGACLLGKPSNKSKK